MDTVPVTDSRQVHLADCVTFTDGRRTYTGHIARKGRTYAQVVADDGTEFRVPYTRLARVLGAARHYVQSQTDSLRSTFHAGDRVSFAVAAETLYGTVSRLNPTYARVVCDDDREYRVPYARLQRAAASPAAPPSGLRRTDADLAAIAAHARTYLATYRLEHWSFQFDHASKRAGCCNYRDQVISLAHAYAQQATQADIDDTILHEIAHALVGREHGHDAVWRAQAMALGCSGARCHDVQFTPPRYIISCAQGCWVATAERRRRGIVCRTCRGPVHYATYTEARWQQANAQG